MSLKSYIRQHKKHITILQFCLFLQSVVIHTTSSNWCLLSTWRTKKLFLKNFAGQAPQE